MEKDLSNGQMEHVLKGNIKKGKKKDLVFYNLQMGQYTKETLIITKLMVKELINGLTESNIKGNGAKT